VVSVTLLLLFTRGKDPVPIVQEAEWAPGPVWTGAENVAPTGIQSPDRPARSQSLYRLRYPAHKPTYDILKNYVLCQINCERMRKSNLPVNAEQRSYNGVPYTIPFPTFLLALKAFSILSPLH
jgi:hypothetical protein